jgi:hypothetical protein
MTGPEFVACLVGAGFIWWVHTGAQPPAVLERWVDRGEFDQEGNPKQ